MYRGQSLTIRATGRLAEIVSNGSYAHIQVKWIFVSLIDKDFDLCENADMADKKCPIEKGAFNITKEVVIPKAVPPGKYHVTAAAFTKDEADGGKKITCLEGQIKFT